MNKKYSAFVKFKGRTNGKMEFSNSLKRLKKLILIDNVSLVEIYDCVDKHYGKDRLILTLTSQTHTRYSSLK